METALGSARVSSVRRGRCRAGGVGGARAAAAVVSVLLAAGVCGLALVGLPGAGAGGAARAGQRRAGGLPLAAQGPVSRILGRDDRSYRAARAGGGFVVRNPGQRLHAWFGSRGVVVGAGGGWLGLRLSAYGQGGRWRAVGAVAPRARANRVVYRRGGVVEWYANGPLGLEQGFTLVGRPAGGAAGAVTLALALSGNLRASLGRGAGSVIFSRRGVSLAYRGLVASDARGRRLPARIELRADRLLLVIDARDARYPLRVDPFVQQAKLTASDGAVGDNFGYSLAASDDTVVAGAPYATVGANADQGAVYVFLKPTGGWANETQAAKLTASDGAVADQFGTSVAIDGDTVVAGSRKPNTTQQGAVYVFLKPASGWANETQAAELTASDGAAGDNLGASVAVSGDTVVAGAPQATRGGHFEQGAVYVFQKPASGWANETQQAELTASDGAADDQLGGSVAIDGDTVVAAAPVVDAVYVFLKPASGWADETQQAKLTGAGQSGEVAVSGDTVVVGAADTPAGGQEGAGAVFVFLKPAGGWADETQPQAELTASDGAALDFLGASVAISGDTIVAGAPQVTVGNQSQQGAEYVFLKPASGWANETQQAELTAADGAAYDELGWSVAVSGGTVVAGAPLNTSFSQNVPGAVYEFGVAARDPTSTGVSCSPGTLAVGQASTCTATVTDTASATPSTPTGSVSFGSNTSGGSFSPSGSCTLAATGTAGQAACRVSYTPGRVGTGKQNISANYGGDSAHETSTGMTTVTVTAARDNDDFVQPVSTLVKTSLKPGTKTTFVFTIGPVTITSNCTASSTSGTTPAHGLVMAVKPMAFTGCTDSLPSRDIYKTTGVWHVTFLDAANDDAKEAPGDRLAITVPIKGITVTSSYAPNCTITVAPTAPARIVGAYNNVNTLTITKAPVPIAQSGTCPGGAKTSTGHFSGTYVLTPGVHDAS